MTGGTGIDVKYYSLKLGRKNINGIVLRVNPDLIPEKRIRHLYGDMTTSYLKHNRGMEHYRVEIKGSEKPLKPETRIEMIFSDKRGLSLSKVPKRQNIYIEEIGRHKAYELAEEARNWRLMQGWIAD